MLDIGKYQKEIEAICRELSLQRLDLIGSASRDDFSPRSDIDVMVTFQGGGSLFTRYFALKERLEKLFERPVDVIEERAISNPYFLRAVSSDRVKLYGE
ncbi:MAG TPA: nucleotidyltransferase domain-containing protein [Pyrinomonadaceae bacterium]|nr:nucleotidyltransferase domain-containing protein [Pyrinomonadaceae bacterium]